MIHKLEHIGIMVKDMDRSVRFYTETLGLQLRGREKLGDGVELGFLAYPGTDNIVLELIARWRDDLPAKGNVDHVAFTVTDIEAEVERLKGLGVEMIDSAPKELPICGGVKIAFFYGPDGERLELFQYNR
ncbi:glyoxalase [Gordoniibacillus kamchatkensis]|uniref:Glyoxalase n=1 Tax=Gordoniibacillus kamchatkensis TaxID=1590651 RepID=A0ABR5AMS4_9BACL|nr:VOC family protein [Paenibacillus sp. VKM B-2647]KIL42246.1 glyoxalase [Paenibacillus sp. VKM B-2647]